MSEKTIQIRLLISVTGGVNYAAGEVVFETPEIAKDLVNAKHAEYVDGRPANYTATKPSDTTQKATSKAAATAEKR